MTSFGKHMGPWVVDPTKKGWLTSIFELGAWFGCSLSRFPCEDALSQACNLSQRGPVCDRSHHPTSRRCWRSFLYPWRPLHHWFGGWCNVCQRTQLQCGSRTSRGPRQLGRSSTISHYSGDHGLVLNRLRYQQCWGHRLDTVQRRLACSHLSSAHSRSGSWIGLPLIAILFSINQHQWATHKAAGWAAVTSSGSWSSISATFSKTPQLSIS